VGENAVAQDARYWAFISYSHRDAAFGRRLHRRLETYVLPHHLIGRSTTHGLVPKRLSPIFRDREELPAANDLSAEVHAALRASASLIVVCSPAAASSPWVSREVETFRALHPDRPILAAIRDGEPSECFPPSLLGTNAAGETVEPLAADFRRGRDGPGLGLLKLVAGVIGIGLDELVQRDSQRYIRRVTAITASALIAMLVMGLLTIFAFKARSEAERQRAEAEGLVGFMSTDLRYKLRGVGRLDIMTAVNERALRYYDSEHGRETDEMRARRARILQALGEDDETRDDLAGALQKFQEAARTTASLFAKEPNNRDRIFDQAQTEYFFGAIEFDKRHFDAALPWFQAYKRLSDRLVAMAPNDPWYRREAGYAEGALCSIALRKHSGHAEALRACPAALDHIQRAARSLPASSGIEADLINRHAWLADAWRANGDLARARAERLIEETLLVTQMKNDPLNTDLKEDWVSHQLALATIAEALGQKDEARTRLDQAKAVIDSMIAFDPDNHAWSHERTYIETELSKLASNPH
jgi:hypothetical protein